MGTTTFTVPAGLVGSLSTQYGNYQITNGQVTVDSRLSRQLLRAGFTNPAVLSADSTSIVAAIMNPPAGFVGSYQDDQGTRNLDSNGQLTVERSHITSLYALGFTVSSFIYQGSTPPIPTLLPHLMLFGHSQEQQEYSVYNGTDAIASGSDVSSTPSFAKSFRAMGNGASVNALARGNNTLLCLPVIDPAGTSPAAAGNGKSYLLADLRAMSGGLIADASGQLDRASASGMSFAAAILWIGTNDLPFASGQNAAHLALLQKAASLFPNTKWAVLNIAPTTTASTSGYTTTRTPANISAANATIAQNVASMGSNFTLIDVNTPLKARGDGTYGRATDYQVDGLHFATGGGGVLGVALQSWLASLSGYSTNLRRPMLKASGSVKDAVRLFNGSTTSTFSQPTTGTGVVSGTRPSAIGVVSVPAAMNSNIVFSIVANPDTTKGGNCVQMVITCQGTATSEKVLLVMSSILNTAGSLAGKPLQAGLRIRDNNEAPLLQYTLEAYDSASKANRIYHNDVSAEPLGGSGARVIEMWTPVKRGEADQGNMEIDVTLTYNPSVGGTITLLLDVDLDYVDGSLVQGVIV